MTVKGLPPIDVPWWLQDPHSCKNCTHFYYRAGDTAHRYPMCGRTPSSQQCRYERHETGSCGEAALYWKERGV